MGHLWYRGPLALYDRAYRWAHGLDRCAARIGPLIRLEQRRQRSHTVLPDGTVVARRAPIGVIHLDNATVAALHAGGRNPMAIGLEFRRQLLASLHTLAVLTRQGERLAHLEGFAATTILPGLRRLGFVPTPGPVFPRAVALYQHALLSWVHPAGRRRANPVGYRVAHRLMISRRELLRRYGQPALDAPTEATADGVLSGSARPASGRP